MVKIEDETLNPDGNVAESSSCHDDSTHDPYYPPIVSLPEVEIPSGEDGEEELIKMRAKLFRFDAIADPAEWKERGTGDVKILRHKEIKGKIRILMRRDKTLKVCANHFIQPWMLLRPMKSSDRAWMWLVQADYADEEAKSETLAIRFANIDNAKKFKDAFDSAVVKVTEYEAERIDKVEKAIQPEKTVTEEGGVTKRDEKNADESAADKLSTLTIK